jgi:hypothetical protein
MRLTNKTYTGFSLKTDTLQPKMILKPFSGGLTITRMASLPIKISVKSMMTQFGKKFYQKVRKSK